MKKFIIFIGLSLFLGTASNAQDYYMDTDGGAIGAGTTINGCGGTISEGIGDYSNNDAFQVTFCAPAGQAIQLTFGQWDIEGCCDYVTVYDNNTNSGTQLYYGDGADPNPGVVTSTGNCITITWDSDGSVINGGWDATISCYTPGTCSDGIQNQNETGIDCGGTYCYPCTCYNGVQDAGEDGTDCGTVCGVPCPCEITVDPSPAALPCGGGTVSIEATGQGGTNFALNNDFQGGAGNGWNVSPAGQFNNPCDPSVDGGTYMWMGSTTAAPRTLETTPLDVECGGDICFFLDFATQGDLDPCEGPDLTNEGVFLEYSIDNGATWVTINYFDPGTGTTGPYLTWDQYCFPIPAAAETPTTIFHWFQNGSSGTCCDHWGIDNVTITSQSCNPYVYEWTQAPAGSTYPNDSTITSTITTTTDFTVCYTNNVDDTCCTTITIAVGSLDPLVVNGTDEVCLGASDGTITVDPATGGTAPYTYDITGPMNVNQVGSGSFTGLLPGNYSITVTDNAGCQSISTFTIAPGVSCCPMTNTEAYTDITCFGLNDGTITLTENLGAAPVTFSIDNGATTQATGNFTGLSAGTYQVLIEDGNGCQYLTSIEIMEPPIITITPTVVDATCGLANGSITVVGGGGSGSGYTYSIDGGTTYQGSGSFPNLIANNYTIAVQDGSGCVLTMVVAVNNGGAPTIDNVVITEPSCDGVCDGSITITASGGTGTITYSIDNGATYQAGNSFTALCGNSYDVAVIDGLGCPAFSSTLLTTPDPIEFDTNMTNLLCSGDCIGQIEVISVTGGDGAYEYSNDNGAAFQAGNTFSTLCANNYTVVVQDGNLCQGTMAVTITEPTLLTIANTFTDPLCNGACDGTIDLTEGGGTAPFEYSIDNGVTFLPTGVFTDVCGGVYDIVIQDANGCQAIDQITLTDPVAVSFTPTPVDATCGMANGQIDITALGGDGNYTYSNDNGATSQPGNSFTSLLAGNYIVIVTDGNSCADTVVVSISNLGAPLIDSIVITEPLCPGVCDGTINIFATGGAGGYQYSTDNGATFQAASIFNGQCSGSYDIIVEDANLCQVAGNTTLTDPAAMSYTATVTNLDCFGVCIGVIDISAVVGGDGNYTYSNDNGGTMQPAGTFSSLCAGPYDVLVEDGNGCQSTSIETVTEPTIVDFTFTTDDNTCNQLNAVCDGQITITGTGGTGTYTYSIDNGVTFVATNVFTGLCAGPYDVIVMDANNCSATQIVTILEPTFLDFTSTTVLTSCGAANGEITLTGQGGTGVYEYSIDNGASYQAGTNFTGLVAAAYDCCVRDASGCTFCTVVSVNNNSGQTITNIAFTEPTCNASCDGTITTTVAGGAAPIMYSLDGGTMQASNVFTGVCGGVHTITTQDDNGCQAGGNVTLTDPDVMAYVPVITDLDCFEQCIGVIDFTASSGGNGVYQYSIDGGVTFQPGTSFTNLCAGNYDLMIEDGNLCSASSTETISEPTQMAIAFSTIDATCTGFCDGSAAATISGGVTPYDYQWSGGIAGNTDTDALNLCANNYDLIVLDANGCQIDTMQFVVGEPGTFVVNAVSVTDELCNADCQGTIDIDAPGAVTYSIDNNATNQPGQLFAGLCEGNYDIYVSNAAGCVATTTSAIGTPPLLTLTQGSDTLICISGTADICGYATGGTLPYTYSWNIPATGQCQSVSPITDTSYEVYIEDANGCDAPPRTITVFVNPILQVFAYQDQSICPGDTAQIEASAMGGNGGPYTYTWINDQNGTVLNGELFLVNPPVTTTYTAIVTDNCGTPADSSSITITVLPLPVLEWSVDQQTGCDPLEVNFTNLTNGTLLGNCQWDFGDGTTSSDCDPTHVFSPGCYDVTFAVFSPEGCKSDTVLVNYICVSEVPIPEFDFGPQPTTILSSAISFTNLSTGAVTYFWDFGFDNETSTETDPQNIAFPSIDPGTYNVCLTATSSAGCDSTICYDVIINDEFLFYIPNSFTPNGDGVNDVFLPKVRGHDPLSYELLIFNRWGELIFESSHPTVGWDGYYKGTLSKTEAYVWKIRVKDNVNGEQKEYIGHVSLLR